MRNWRYWEGREGRVARKPAKAGIDPLNKLIDRTPKDNTVTVSGL
jgi:hypothetical protein